MNNLEVKLPNEAILSIFNHLKVPELDAVSKVSREWRRLSFLSQGWVDYIALHCPHVKGSELSFYQAHRSRPFKILNLEKNKRVSPPKYSYKVMEESEIKAKKRKFKAMIKTDSSEGDPEFIIETGKRHVSGCKDGKIVIQDLDTKQENKIDLSDFIGNQDKVLHLTSLDILNDELACGLSNGKVLIYNLNLKTPMMFQAHVASISALKLDHERCFVFSNEIPVMKVWDLRKDKFPKLQAELSLKIDKNSEEDEWSLPSLSGDDQISNMAWDGRILEAKITGKYHQWDFGEPLAKKTKINYTFISKSFS